MDLCFLFIQQKKHTSPIYHILSVFTGLVLAWSNMAPMLTYRSNGPEAVNVVSHVYTLLGEQVLQEEKAEERGQRSAL